MTTKEELPLLAGARAARQRAPLRPPPAHEGARGAQEAAGERPQAEACEEGAAGGDGEAGGGHGGRGGRPEEGPGGREEGGKDHEGEETAAPADAEEAARQAEEESAAAAGTGGQEEGEELINYTFIKHLIIFHSMYAWKEAQIHVQELWLLAQDVSLILGRSYVERALDLGPSCNLTRHVRNYVIITQGAEGAARAVAGEGPFQVEDESEAGAGDAAGIRKEEAAAAPERDEGQRASSGKEEEDRCQQHLLRTLRQIVSHSGGLEEAREVGARGKQEEEEEEELLGRGRGIRGTVGA